MRLKRIKRVVLNSGCNSPSNCIEILLRNLSAYVPPIIFGRVALLGNSHVPLLACKQC